MEITKQEREQIKNFIQSDNYELLERVKEDLLRKFALQSCIGADQWETLTKTLSREYSIGGINSLFAYLVELAKDKEEQI